MYVAVYSRACGRPTASVPSDDLVKAARRIQIGAGHGERVYRTVCNSSAEGGPTSSVPFGNISGSDSARGGKVTPDIQIAAQHLQRKHTIAAYRSEEHTSELQSHSFISYAVFCLK